MFVWFAWDPTKGCTIGSPKRPLFSLACYKVVNFKVSVVGWSLGSSLALLDLFRWRLKYGAFILHNDCTLRACNGPVV